MAVTRAAWRLALCTTILLAAPLSMSAAECLTESRTPIVLKTRSTAPNDQVRALLVANLLPELRILATTGRPLWSASATGSFTQLFPDMTAGFTSSITAIDLDGDGAEDRIYAGDALGRLWRFDLHGDAVSPRVTGGVFADLGEGLIGRGFVAAPDVTLMVPAVGSPWLSIAIGTANTSSPLIGPVTAPMTHHFYVLRDRGPLERWTQLQHDRWEPLDIADLVLAGSDQIDARLIEGAGFYLNLGTRQVLAPALTLDGKTIFTLAHTTQSQLLPCGTGLQTRLTVSVGAVSATDGMPAMDLDGDGSRDAADLDVPLETPADAAAAVMLVLDDNASGSLQCMVAGETLPDCSLDTRLHRSFWRREDAD